MGNAAPVPCGRTKWVDVGDVQHGLLMRTPEAVLFSGETRFFQGRILHHIRAVCDLPGHSVNEEMR